MKALVTGGGGFLGRYIVEQLLDRGDAVRVLSRGAYPELATLGVELVQGDVRFPHHVERACAGVDVVFHAAALAGVWGPWKTYYQINTVGTRNIIAACLDQRIGRLIYTSSPSVVYDGRPHVNADESLTYPADYLCAYPATKAIAEREVLEANQPGRLLTVALRPHLIWGPRDNHLIPRLIQRARSGRLRRVGDGSNEVSASYVENAAAAHLQACDALTPESPAAGQAYFVNELQPVRLWGWVDELLARAGLPPVDKSISPAAARRVGAVLETCWRLLPLPGEPPMTRFLASQLSQTHTYSIARAQRDFNYRPIVAVDEGLRKLEPELRRLAAQAS